MPKQTQRKGHILVAEIRINGWQGEKCSSRTVTTEQKTSKEGGHVCETKQEIRH